MAKIRLALASVLAMLLVGAWTPAHGGPPTESAAPRQAWTLFGTTLCLPDAPADLTCDVRLGAQPEPAAPAPRVVSLFGFDLCLGEVAPTASCDLRLPAPPPRKPDQHARR
jgi:hypothetical protein